MSITFPYSTLYEDTYLKMVTKVTTSSSKRKKQKVKKKSGTPDRSKTSQSMKRDLRKGEWVLEDHHEYRVDRHTFTIYLANEQTSLWSNEEEHHEPSVEHNMANRFETNIRLLSNINPKEPILVVLASDGGYWEPGMQIFSAILSCPNPVTVVATRNARSMTSMIPLAADKFVMRPPANYMFHHGYYGFYGIVQQALTEIYELIRSREMMLQMYTSRLREQGRFQRKRWSRERITEMLEGCMKEKIDAWLSADEAVDWGFVDAVFSGSPSEVPRAKKKNVKRREAMERVLRQTVNVEITVDGKNLM